MGRFVHLHTHSHYSLLDGLSKIDALVARVKELGMDALGLTDHGVLYGAVEFYKKAAKAGVKPILGMETYVAPRDRFSREPGERYNHLILLAENNAGWHNLIKLSTKAHLEGFYYKPRVDKELLRGHHHGLIALSGCMGSEVNQALLADRFDDAKRIAAEYADIFGAENLFLEIQHHPNLPQARKLRDEIIRLAKETGLPLVATQDIHYTRPEDAEYHDILLAVQTGSRLADDDRLTMKQDDFSITSPEQMVEHFADIPEAITNTATIADRCNVTLDLGTIHLPRFPKPEGKTADEYLNELLNERLPERFPSSVPRSGTSVGRSGATLAPEARERLAYEADIITKTGFADYFLIVADLVTWAKAHGIAVGPGRGSAAGSIVSYVLGITDVNPLDYDLLFERFLNPERVQMPDIDIDFADTRRDEVLAYAREKYGEDRVAQIITFGTMAARAAVRDAGRAMGFTYGFCDQIAKLIPFNMSIAESIKAVPELASLAATNPDAKKLLETAEHLEGVARHASVHACGTVFSEEPLVNYVPLQLAPQDKTNVITQFEMHSIEDLGLLKIDLLGLRNLTIIGDTVRLIRELHGEDLKIETIPLDDQKTFELLRAGDTTGVFQFESSGMRRYMKDIRPTQLEDLIALVALFRPGPMELIPLFIRRKHGQETVTYLHPKLEPILANTYGIGVYQEQMMRIARDLAGFTLPEADTLRKAIGKKIRSLLNEQQEKIVSGMIRNGIDARTAEAVWELFPPFARYGFNKSHATCYALIGYRTAYLKAHYPEEFMASLLNAELADIDRIAFLVHEAKHSKIDVLPPDVNASSVHFAPEGEKIRFGLLAVKNVGEQIARTIVEERVQRGPFKDFNDFLCRIQHKDLNKKSLESLARAGVFDSLGVERNQVLQNLDEIVRFTSLVRKSAAEPRGASLFGEAPRGTLQLAPAPPAPLTERLRWEKELLGLYLSDHPLNAYGAKMKMLQLKPLDEVAKSRDEATPVRIVGLVSKIQKIVTKSGQPMLFVTLEDFSPKALEVVVFNNTLKTTESLWTVGNVIIVEGRVSRRNDEPKFVCDRAQKLEP